MVAAFERWCFVSEVPKTSVGKFDKEAPALPCMPKESLPSSKSRNPL